MTRASTTVRWTLPVSLLTALAVPAAAQQLPPPPAPPQNPITAEKAVLGKMLFWDEQLSSDNTVACGTCHIPASGGADPRTGSEASRHPGPDGLNGTADDIFGTLGVLLADAEDKFVESDTFGYDPQVTARQSPSTIGAAYFQSLFWDGRATSTFVDPETGATVIPNGGALESQAVGPPTSSVEMAHEARDWSEITAKLVECPPLKLASNLTPDIVTALTIDPTYPELFENAFGTPDITATRIAFAIATYQRTLVPNQTPFDLGTLNPGQQQALGFFNGPGRCAQCHSGPLFSDGSFRNIGVRPPAEDQGRRDVTGNFNDRGRFKVPTLRNVGLRNRFFHNGSVPGAPGALPNTIRAVINFYDRGGDFAENRDPLMNQINIPPPVRPGLEDLLVNGLTDNRVRNEMPPFDRPTLFSETPAATPDLSGAGTIGSGLYIPSAIISSPPSVGTPGFKVGVANGRGGAIAHLMVVSSATTPNAGGGSFAPLGLALRTPLETIVLDGAGDGAGFGTVHLDLGNLPTPLWPELSLQWWIMDSGGRGGIAKSERINLSLLF